MSKDFYTPMFADDPILSYFSLRGLFQDSYACAIGLSSPPWFDQRRKKICKICGRKEDFLFNFTPLNSMLNSESRVMEHECTDHGGMYGKLLWDCFSGEYRQVPPSPPRVYIWLRNRLQDFTLYSYYLVQFLSSFFRYLFWWAALSLASRIPSIIPILRRMTNNECES